MQAFTFFDSWAIYLVAAPVCLMWRNRISRYPLLFPRISHPFFLPCARLFWRCSIYTAILYWIFLSCKISNSTSAFRFRIIIWMSKTSVRHPHVFYVETFFISFLKSFMSIWAYRLCLIAVFSKNVFVIHFYGSNENWILSFSAGTSRMFSLAKII